MFPTQSISTITAITDTTGEGITYAYDFDTGDFILENGNPKILTGIEGLKMWIKKTLKTKKNKFRVYGSDSENNYGVTLLDFVNSDYPFAFIKAELQREITESLLINSKITGVSDFSFTRNKRTLIVTFTVKTTYGEVSEEVTV